jgi:carotenoid cleavage dioxygenase-like enzyme
VLTSAPGLLDVSSEPHLQGVFAPVVDEVDVSDLSIEGELPAEIDPSTACGCQRRSSP